MERLEAREKDASGAKILSHGHLNKVTKATDQVRQSTKRIMALGQEWRRFADSESCQVVSVPQSGLARGAQCQHLQEAKQALSQASQSLIGQSLPPATMEEMPEIMPAVEEMQNALNAASAVDEVGHLLQPEHVEHVEDDDVSQEGSQAETPEVELVPASGPSRQSNVRAVPFRGAGSPNRVANQALKHKCWRAFGAFSG